VRLMHKCIIDFMDCLTIKWRSDHQAAFALLQPTRLSTEEGGTMAPTSCEQEDIEHGI